MKAIILAAGMGTRLRPYTNNTPKPLVKVNGTPIIERQIEFLIQKKIYDITIVIGYLNEKFNYLKEKYNVKLIYNEKYAEYNNIYSMYLVRDLLSNTYVIEGDIFIKENIFQRNLETSRYFCQRRDRFKNEWVPFINERDEVIRIEVSDGQDKYILSGISYWNQYDGEFIANKLEEAIRLTHFKELFWDDIVMRNIHDIRIKLERLMPFDSYEIDCAEDLFYIESVIT